MSQPHLSLRHSEAIQRRSQLTVTAYDVRLDLAASEETFRSVTTIDLTSTGGRTFLDVKPVALHAASLDGLPLDVDLLEHGRYPLDLSPGDHRITVDATMRFRNDGEGLHRSVDPADGRHYVYGMSFMDAAPSIFACFDQPDLKARYTFHVIAPPAWTVVGNAPGEQVGPGVWEFEQTQPLSTYFVTLVAGPWHLIRTEHDGIPLSLSSRTSIAADLNKDAEELFTLTRACFDEYHRLFGIRYPFGSYHQAFVPEFNAGAMENPGCVTFRDPLVFTSRVTRGQRIQRAVTVAHEMAHQWFGNLTTPVWWDDLWLNESFAEYMGNRVTASVTEYDDAWTHNAFTRRQWGLVADQRPSTHPVAGNRARDAASALQDFDGISYNKGASILRQLNTVIGDDVFLAGAVDHFTRARFGNATMADLFGCWERAGAGDLSAYVEGWLRSAGPDRISFDREAGELVTIPPTGQGWARAHHLSVAVASPGGTWREQPVVVEGRRTPLDVPPGSAVVIDPREKSWALALPDQQTVLALPSIIAGTASPMVRAGIWNNIRSGLHNACVSSAEVLSLIEAWLPVEDNDDALAAVLPWALAKVVPLSPSPTAALARIHEACMARLATASGGTTVQLAVFRAAVGSAGSAALLRAWLGGDQLPSGLVLDADLRWLVLVQLAAIGDADEAELRRELDADPTTKARVDFARAMASRPAGEAKAWAWRHFTGEVEATNYELEAIGQGMWRAGQEHLTEPYVEDYFAALATLPSVHAGWVLGQVTDAFFPMTSMTEATLEPALAAAADKDLDATVRRRLVDAADELRRRIAVRDWPL